VGVGGVWWGGRVMLAGGGGVVFVFFFCNDTATTEIYTTTDTLSLHDALPISEASPGDAGFSKQGLARLDNFFRSEEHRSELQSPVVISYAVFCLKKKKKKAACAKNQSRAKENETTRVHSRS